jgi:hypothetical protein
VISSIRFFLVSLVCDIENSGYCKTIEEPRLLVAENWRVWYIGGNITEVDWKRNESRWEGANVPLGVVKSVSFGHKGAVGLGGFNLTFYNGFLCSAVLTVNIYDSTSLKLILLPHYINLLTFMIFLGDYSSY